MHFAAVIALALAIAAGNNAVFAVPAKAAAAAAAAAAKPVVPKTLTINGKPNTIYTPAEVANILKLAATNDPANGNCVTLVPVGSVAGSADPLNLVAMGKPWPVFNCDQLNVQGNAAYIDIMIYDKVANTLHSYAPLLINIAKADANGVVDLQFVPPTPPAATLVQGNIVAAVGGGVNGATYALKPLDPKAQLVCINGITSGFVQYVACPGDFYTTVNPLVAAGTLTLPPLGVSPVTGTVCPWTGYSGVVDMDSEDNAASVNVVTAKGLPAQDLPANNGNGSTVIVNGSDNKLVVGIEDPLLQCIGAAVPNAAVPTFMQQNMALSHRSDSTRSPRRGVGRKDGGGGGNVSTSDGAFVSAVEASVSDSGTEGYHTGRE